jgi:fumarate hydratase subunit alpha
MKIVKAEEITNKVCELTIKANISLRKDVLAVLKKSLRTEKNPRTKKIISIIIENADIAERKNIPICQDTGMAVVFCEIGQNVHIEGDINKAITEGIRLGYKKGFLRKSVVSDPLLRKNTMTNTPAVIHYSFVKGDNIKLTVLPKGFGSENAGRTAMLSPTDSEKEIIDFVVTTVKEKGADACPPLILGIGIGGTLDKAAFLAKKATLNPIGRPNPKGHLANLERKILKEVNKTGIGPAGLGGKTTCLGVSILDFATHIAGLPVAVNVSCHAFRSASATI